MTDREALLANIRVHPDDDLARLVYCDWLEENREGDLAKFIRTQIALHQAGHRREKETPEQWDTVLDLCEQVKTLLDLPDPVGSAYRYRALPLDGGAIGLEYEADEGINPMVLVSRGFVARVTCPLNDWLQGPCECMESGTCYSDCPETTCYNCASHCACRLCPTCKGQGYIAVFGVGVALAAHPVRRVTPTDKVPWEIDDTITHPFVWRPPSGPGGTRERLPWPIYHRLTRPGYRCEYGRYYSTEEDAYKDLSDTLIGWSRDPNRESA